jgi:hypothetical protein
MEIMRNGFLGSYALWQLPRGWEFEGERAKPQFIEDYPGRLQTLL